ncbi:MAG: rane protein, partial [Actinomycetota bacterium]|nr:rane protein [Actinomycetota bacterium]
MKAIQDVMRKFDSIQKSNSFLGFVIGVVKKFGDDQAGYLAALVAYYAFFSLFPLLLAFTSILGFVLQGHPGAEQSVVHSALKQIPLIGADIGNQ